MNGKPTKFENENRVSENINHLKMGQFLNALKLLLFLATLTISVTSCISTGTAENKKNVSLTVEIDYGNCLPPVTKTVIWKHENPTALEALQAAATVETAPRGEYIFVTSIDGVKSKRGDKAWYYTVNGRSPGKLAVWNNLEHGDTVRWIYKNDVCSKNTNKNIEVAK